ncbi:STM4014 family protein [Candidatus Obscuribacterales bacterium]|nr:STM4014 family protein [Candidatus Obscuribacterales bacterium]
MRRLVWIGTEGRRLELFRNTLEQSEYGQSFEGIIVVPFRGLIRGAIELTDVIERDDVVRIESPGKDFELERDLLRLGISSKKSDFDFPGALSHDDIDALTFERGLILSQPQWYRGWCRLLNLIDEKLKTCAPHIVMNSSAEIETLFDKTKCLELFRLAEIRTAKLLGPVHGFNDLVEIMDRNECNRVFVKPAHSSSASGIVAFERSQNRQLASTTVEVVSTGGKTSIYNTRRVRRIYDIQEIRTLIDRLGEHNLFAEKWYPKAGLNGKTFDLRVVTIGGECRHVVVRESLTPFTNLHLLNGRGQLQSVRKAMGEILWNDVMDSCRRVAGVFPNCLYLGIDVLVSSDMRSHVVAEANAFGDLLPGILCDGLSTYEWELKAMQHRLSKAGVNA